MHTHTETRILPYKPQQLFTLIIDIERYPEFLPWCRAARIVSRAADSFIGELIISFSHLTERYSSRVTPIVPPPLGGRLGGGQSLAMPHSNNVPLPASPLQGEELLGEYRIEVELVEGPFKFLNNHWRLVPHAEGTELHFAVEFEFKSKLLNTLMGSMFTRASEKMVGAFTKRAEALYGATQIS